MSGPWTEAAGTEIGAAWIEREIAPAGAFGRRARDAERAFICGDEAQARAAIARVDAVAREVAPETLATLHAVIASCPEPGAALARAQNGVLGDAELFDVCRLLDAIRDVRALALHPLFAVVGLPPLPQALAETLARGRGRDRSFYIGDAFDAALASARTQAANACARLDGQRSRLAARVAAYAGVDHVRDGEFVLFRDTAPAPLPPEVRVLREAPTYYLCELALDEAALAALAASDDAAALVAQSEDAVRERLSADVRGALPMLDEAVRALGVLDAFVARARFTARYGGCVPDIPDDGGLAFVAARFVPLERTLAERGHRYVALSMELDGVAVLTGPNMGGKTAALRTCGFVAACVALGVPVPATSARVPLYDEIAWVGTAAESADDSLLSSFGREVVHLRDFLERKRRRPLALVDEFARTTSPREGRALLLALIATLAETGVAGLAATHLSRIAEDAGVPHYAVAGLRSLPQTSGAALSLDAAIKRIAAVMDYRVTRVAAQSELSADALALAGVLGLDPALVARARDGL